MKNFFLIRYDFLADGIFGILGSKGFCCQTLEHAYPQDSGFLPKVPVGKYTCLRGLHRLEGMTQDFETFEIQNVPGHSGILFHTGNVNNDSSACVLLGTLRTPNSISYSRPQFDAFLNYLKGQDQFNLEVINAG